MGTTYRETKTSIRRRGTVITFSKDNSDSGWTVKGSSTRRDRQIAKRHWVLRVDSWSSSGGGAGEEVSVKTPGKGGFTRKRYWP